MAYGQYNYGEENYGEDNDYAVDIVLAGLEVEASAISDNFMTVDIELPLVLLSAESQMTATGIIDADIELPGIIVYAEFGNSADIILPSLTVEASLVSDAPISADIILPLFETDSGISSDSVMSCDIELQPFTVEVVIANGIGIVSDITFPGFTVTSRMIDGLSAAADIELSGFEVDAIIIYDDIIVSDVILPSLFADSSISSHAAVTTYSTVVMNLENKAISEYSNFPFDNLLYFAGKFIGQNSTGFYELAGDTDNGVAIKSEIKTGIFDASKSGVKGKIREAWFTGRTTGDLEFWLEEDEKREIECEVIPNSEDKIGRHRVKFPRGMKGEHYACILRGTGDKFDINNLRVLDNKLPERVR